MTAVLPLISPEKGAQLGFVAQGVLLVVSGVYYPVERAARLDAGARRRSRPATYALEGVRGAILDGQGLSSMWHHLAAARHRRGLHPAGPLGVHRGERYAKRHGKLKRSGQVPCPAMPSSFWVASTKPGADMYCWTGH